MLGTAAAKNFVQTSPSNGSRNGSRGRPATNSRPTAQRADEQPRLGYAPRLRISNSPAGRFRHSRG